MSIHPWGRNGICVWALELTRWECQFNLSVVCWESLVSSCWLVVEHRALRFSLSFVGEAVLIACSKVSSRGTFSLQLLGCRGSGWLASWLQCAGPVSVLKQLIRLRVQTRFFLTVWRRREQSPLRITLTTLQRWHQQVDLHTFSEKQPPI